MPLTTVTAAPATPRLTCHLTMRIILRTLSGENLTGLTGNGNEYDPIDASPVADDCRPTVVRLSTDSRPTVGRHVFHHLYLNYASRVGDVSVVRW